MAKKRDAMTTAAMALALRAYASYKSAVRFSNDQSNALGVLHGLYLGALYFGPSDVRKFIDKLKDRANGMRYSAKQGKVIWRDELKEKAA